MGTYSNNVVPISGRGSDPGVRIIEECRERLNRQLVEWLQSIHSEIAEDLFTLADSTSDRKTQARYLDLRRKVQGQWSEIIAEFRRTLSKQLSQNPSVTLEMPDFSGLQLIDDDKLEESILIRESSARLAETCNNELYCLDRRIAQLLNEQDVENIKNPLAPSPIVEALAESTGTLVPETEARILLLRRIEKHLHKELPVAYESVNKYLIDLGVLADLKRTLRRSSSQEAAQTPSDKSPGKSSGSQTAEKQTSEEGGLMNLLQRLVGARNGFIEPGPQTASSTNIGGSVPTNAVVLSDAFLASLDQIQAVESSPLVNQIQIIRNSDAATKVGHVEAVTIDIVAMLFDFIFNDKDISNGVKALVGRLQIPVLKVAMLDQSFFGNRSHPVRRFLDEISGISLRWGGNIDAQDPFYITLAHLIEKIHEEFADDIEVFGRALEELRAFVSQREEEEEETTRIAAAVAARREREAAAWERAQSAVKEATLETMPAVMAEFFRDQWVEVLQRIAARDEDQEQAWQDAVKLMADLPRSVTPKKTPVERMALISTLPTLLARVNKGLDIVNADKNERRPFFDALVDLHTTALKGEPAKAKPVLPEKPITTKEIEAAPPVVPSLPQPEAGNKQDGGSVDSSDTGDIIVTRSISNGVEVEEITLVGAKPVWSADHQDAARLVADLKRGDWVEFRHDDGNLTRERLTWMSPQRHLLVFSNHRAAKAISIAPDALAKKIREGQASVVADASIFDRAMNGVMETLNKT